MQIINIINKEQLNNFTEAQKHSQFLQAWQWGEFHKKVSGKVFRLGVEDGGELVAVATIIKKILPMGKFYFYCPRGLMVKLEVRGKKLAVAELLFNKIQELAKEEGAMFFRFDPTFKLPEINFIIQQTFDVQPSETLILNLTKPEAELLKNMHQKTRYNIRLAKKKGVKIIEIGLDRFDEFWKLMCETSNRDSFRTHGIDYYKEMLKLDHPREFFGGASKNFIKLFFAEYRKKVISAVVVSFFGDTATYMHGASSNEHREAMAPHLLQWHCIKLAKESGYKYYDFYGIDEKKWPGVTRFKKGFAGKTVKYPGTFDFIFDQNWYSIYKMVRKVRRTF